MEAQADHVDESAAFRMIPVSSLFESKTNPRHSYDEKGMVDLVASVQQKGVLVPLIVRAAKKGFEIIAGSRRFRAATKAKLAEVPVRVCELTDAEALEVQVIENLQREDVHPLDEALGYRQLMEKAGHDVETIAVKVGKSVSYVYQRLKLTDLIPAAQKAFFGDSITAGHAILIARLQPKDQAEMLTHFDRGNAMTVRELARWIERDIHLDLHAAPWKKDDAQLLPAAGACTTCPKRTGFSPQLFPDIAKADTCTDRGCFDQKRVAFVAIAAEKLEEKTGEKVARVSDLYHGYGNKLPAGIIENGKWNLAKSGCPKRPAVITESHESGKTGRAVEICTNPKCKNHGYVSPSYSRSPDEKAREKKAQRTSERRRAVFAAVLEKASAIGAEDLARLSARALVREAQNEARKQACKALGLEIPKGQYGSYSPEKPLNAAIAAAKKGQLGRIIVALIGGGEVSVSPNYDMPGDRLFLNDFAKLCRVAVGKIERELAAKWKAADSAKKASKRGSGKTGSKAKGAKKK